MIIVTIEKLLDKVENDAGIEARIFIERVLEKIKIEKAGRNDFTVLSQYDNWIYGMIFYLWSAHKIDYNTFYEIDTFVSDFRRK